MRRVPAREGVTVTVFWYKQEQAAATGVLLPGGAGDIVKLGESGIRQRMGRELDIATDAHAAIGNLARQAWCDYRYADVYGTARPLRSKRAGRQANKKAYH